ncbi:MAG: alanine racemase [Saprospiraceae bacterium]|nr:alanine racemase [Saprospiraceae bacterium]
MYTPAQIASITGAFYQAGSSPEPAIRHYVIDSRKLIFPGSSIFFAIRSSVRDGHQFVEDLYQAGVRAFVVSSDFATSPFPEAHFIIHDSSLEVLQKLSRHHVDQFELPRIVITGSNGKTIVKEWSFQMLKSDHHIVRSPASFNSQIGVPLSVLQIEDVHDLGIFEAGISTKGEMDKIAEILQGNIGIFLNLGTAHDKGFADKDEKLQEKLKLFKDADTLIYCSDQKKVHKAISKLNIPELLNWGKDPEANPYFQILSTEKHRDDLVVIRGKSEDIGYRIELPYSSDMDIENLMPIIVYMIHVGYSEADINGRLKTLQKIPLRLELRKGLNNTILINDAYSNDLESLQSGLAFLKQQAGSKEKILVLTSFQQVNQDKESLVRAIVTLLKKYKIGFLAGLGEGISNLQTYLPAEIKAEFYPDTQSLLENLLLTENVKDKAILFKGSRHFELEKTIDKLSQLRHRTRLEIDLQALSHNIAVITGHLKPQVKIMAMLKAFGYGTGEIELARFFETIRVDYLGLAYIDEGVKVRQSGVQIPIMIMNPDMDQWEQLIEFQLEPVIYTLSQLERLQKLGVRNQLWPIHIKLDTGMHRLGFMESEVEGLISELQKTPITRCNQFLHILHPAKMLTLMNLHYYK